MATGDGATGRGAERTTRSRSRLFAVRLWAEEGADGLEYRGSARDLATGVFCSFRDWSDLTAFLIARMDEDERADLGRAEGETAWLSRQSR